MSNKPQVLPVNAGGTGVATATAYAPLFGGTTSTGAFQSGTVGTSGHVLTSNGAGSLPTFQAPASSGIPTIGTSTDRAIVTWSGTGGNAVLNNATVVVTSGGAVQTGNGTASAPTHSFTTATTTGLYRTSGGTVGIANGGVGWFTIDSGGDARLEGNATVANKLTCGASNVFQRTSSATNITDVNNGFIFACTNTSSPRTVTLSSSSNAGRVLIVKDESGGAGTNNITISVSGGVKTIDGAASLVINTNYGSARLYYDGTNYFTF